MGKVKKSDCGPRPPPAGGAPSAAAGQSSSSGSVSRKDASGLSLFPPKPPRGNSRPPGRPVDLITNLYMMSMKQKKAIYRYGVNIDIEYVDADKGDDVAKGMSKLKVSDPDRSAKKTVKSQEIRRKALDAAIQGWINNNKPAEYNHKLSYNYLYDMNGSTLYTLFDMFKKGGKALELSVKLKLDAIIEGKLATEEKVFLVCINPGQMINIQALFDYCLQKRAADVSIIQEATRALNVIMHGKIISISSAVVTPINVYPFMQTFKIGPGVIGVKGFSISAKAAECGPVFNVANSIGAFHEEIDLIDLLQTKFFVRDLNRPLHRDTIDKLKREICTKQIEATHINYGTEQKPHYRKYRVGDICGDCLEKFTLVDKKTKSTSQITIMDYFKKEYKVVLRYPKLPCIVDRGRKLPLEVCHLIDKQRVMRKMDPQETATIIREAAVPAKNHFDQIKHNVDLIKKVNQPLQDFGLDFDAKPIEVQGRELDPIKLVDGNRREISPRNGEYQSGKFFKPARINIWTLTFLADRFVKQDRERGGLFEQRFSDLYVQEGRFKGVYVDKMHKSDIIDIERNEQIVKNELRQHFKDLNAKKVDHTIILLPKTCPDWTYRYLQYLETSSQAGRGPNESWTRCSCVKYDNYRLKIINGRDYGKMFLSNLWLKYNTKMGGINYVLVDDGQCMFLKDGYLFISIDVCHPAPGDKLFQSVAAVVGMWDLTNANMSVCTQMRVQKKQRADHSTIEEVGEVGSMIDEILASYAAKKSSLPRNIVVIRDGVSEGQLRMVLGSELKRVRATLQNRYANAKQPIPALTCMVVQKRHKVRFYRKQPMQSKRGPDHNILPGTVVDSKITHPTDFDFYLAAHKAIQGTSKAAHIHVICDEIGFSQDQAQKMIHALSYLSPRCTKSTSIPTPVNLADLAAEQGKNLVVSWADDNMRRQLSEDAKIAELNKFLTNLADRNYKNTLYYI